MWLNRRFPTSVSPAISQGTEEEVERRKWGEKKLGWAIFLSRLQYLLCFLTEKQHDLRRKKCHRLIPSLSRIVPGSSPFKIRGLINSFIHSIDSDWFIHVFHSFNSVIMMCKSEIKRNIFNLHSQWYSKFYALHIISECTQNFKVSASISMQTSSFRIESFISFN